MKSKNKNIIKLVLVIYSKNTQGLNSIFLALLNDLAWKFRSFGSQLQNSLFQQTYPNGTSNSIDLLAYNINRGRDHGISFFFHKFILTYH